MSTESPPDPKFSRVTKNFDFLHTRSQYRVNRKRKLNFDGSVESNGFVSPPGESDGVGDVFRSISPSADSQLPNLNQDSIEESVPTNSSNNDSGMANVPPCGSDFSDDVFLSYISNCSDAELLSLIETDKCDIDVIALIDSTNYWTLEDDIIDDFDPNVLFTSDISEIIEENLSDDDEMSLVPHTFCDKVRTILGNWTLKYRIDQAPVTALLHELRGLQGLESLPATASTLVKTPRNIHICDLPDGGQYFHFGIEKALLKILENVQSGHVELLVNADGVGIFKSSPSQLWPILCRICSIDSVSHIVFLVGCYYGKKKPANPKFLTDFSKEAERLCQSGLQVGDIKFTFSIKACVFDAPAKALSVGCLNCNGLGSCTKCHVYGANKNHRTFFDSETANLRNHNEYISWSDKKFQRCTTPLFMISCLRFPLCLPLDPMHLFYLGCCRTVVYLLLFSKAHNIGIQNKRIITLALMRMKEWKPREFARPPRGLDEVRRMKATEWRQITLHTGMVAFKKGLPENKYESFLYFSVAVRLVLTAGTKDDPELLEFTRGLFLYFIQTVRDIYGKDYITHNFHNLIHICDDLLNFGDLEEISAFKFENFMQFLLKLFRKNELVLQQLARRIEELHVNGVLYDQRRKEYHDQPVYSNQHTDGPLSHGLSDPQYARLKMKFFELRTSKPDNCVTLSGKKVFLISNFCVDKVTKKMMMVGQQFTVKEDFFSKPCESSSLGIYQVSKLQSAMTVKPVDSILWKNYLLPYENSFVAVPLINTEPY